MLVWLFACLFIRLICLCCCKNFGMCVMTYMIFIFRTLSSVLNCCVGFSSMDHSYNFFPIKAMLTEVYMFVLLMCRVEKMGRGFGMRVPRFIQWQVNLAQLNFWTSKANRWREFRSTVGYFNCEASFMYLSFSWLYSD